MRDADVPRDLLEADRLRPTLAEADRMRFGARLRDTHDLWHVVTGYNRDLVGEEAHGRHMIRAAYRRGRRAAWLPAADWEALLQRPLDEVRRELGVGDPPSYQQVRSEAGQAALAAGA